MSHRIDNESRLNNVQGDISISGTLTLNDNTAYKYRFPTSAGSTGQVLALVGSNLQWQTPSSGGSTSSITNTDGTYISSVTVGTGNNIDITTRGALSAQFTSNLLQLYSATGPSTIRFNQTDNTASIGLHAPTTGVTSYDLTLPATLPGVDGQVLSSNTTGDLSWVTASGGGGGVLPGGNTDGADLTVGTHDAFAFSIITSNVPRFTIDSNGDSTILGDGAQSHRLVLNQADNLASIGMRAPVGVTSYDLTLPATLPGVDGQVLSSNTAGDLSWITSGGGGGGVLPGGNTDGADLTVGTIDTYAFKVITNNVPRVTVDAAGDVNILGDGTIPRRLVLHQADSLASIGIKVPISGVTPYDITFPPSAPIQDGQIMSSSASGSLSWTEFPTFDGNVHGREYILGTTDAFGVSLKVGNVTRLSLDIDGNITGTGNTWNQNGVTTTFQSTTDTPTVYTWTVRKFVIGGQSSMRVQLWGAGGASNGGSGAYVEVQLNVSAGQTYHIIAGQGGQPNFGGNIGDTNASGVGGDGSGGGGQYSALIRKIGNSYILIAAAGGGGGGGPAFGGGGGGGRPSLGAAQAGAGNNGAGGAGATGDFGGVGENGFPYAGDALSGHATIQLGGGGGSSNGLLDSGGGGGGYGGGGCGGYGGGGGGCYSPAIDGTYVVNAQVFLGNDATGSTVEPPNAGDPNYGFGWGSGGDNFGGSGGDGEVIVTMTSQVTNYTSNIKTNRCLQMLSTDGSQTTTIAAPDTATSWALILPTDQGSALQYLQTDGTGVTRWETPIQPDLSGDVTSSGTYTTLTNAPVIAKVLTGYVSGAGTVAATDTILQAFQKVNGNHIVTSTAVGTPTALSTANQIVKRGASGEFDSGTITTTGLLLPGVVPTALNYYSESSFNTVFTSGSQTSQGVSKIVCTRIGRTVTIFIPDVFFSGSISTIISSTTAIPADFWNSYSQISYIVGTYKNDGAGQVSGIGTCRVRSTGLIEISNGTTGTVFSGTFCGMQASSFTYPIGLVP